MSPRTTIMAIATGVALLGSGVVRPAGAQTVTSTGVQAGDQADAQESADTADTPSSTASTPTPPSFRALIRHPMSDTSLPVSRIVPSRPANSASTPTAQLARFQIAPTPDLDNRGPSAQSASADASLHPAFFGRQTAFSGDAFMTGSNLEADQAHRQKPTGGLALDIPMQ